MSSTSFALIEGLNSRRPRGADYFFMPLSSVHIEQILITQEDVLVASKYFDIKKAVEAQAQMGIAISAFLGSNPVACFGMVPIWEGVAEGWFIADDKARGRPFALTKMARKFLDIAEISLRLRRTQITVRTTHTQAVSWAGALGFTSEGLMKGYGPDGVDYFLMARYRK